MLAQADPVVNGAWNGGEKAPQNAVAKVGHAEWAAAAQPDPGHRGARVGVGGGHERRRAPDPGEARHHRGRHEERRLHKIS